MDLGCYHCRYVQVYYPTQLVNNLIERMFKTIFQIPLSSSATPNQRNQTYTKFITQCKPDITKCQGTGNISCHGGACYCSVHRFHHLSFFYITFITLHDSTLHPQAQIQDFEMGGEFL